VACSALQSLAIDREPTAGFVDLLLLLLQASRAPAASAVQAPQHHCTTTATASQQQTHHWLQLPPPPAHCERTDSALKVTRTPANIFDIFH